MVFSFFDEFFLFNGLIDRVAKDSSDESVDVDDDVLSDKDGESELLAEEVSVMEVEDLDFLSEGRVFLPFLPFLFLGTLDELSIDSLLIFFFLPFTFFSFFSVLSGFAEHLQ